MKFIDWFIDLFRKKEFYVIDYVALNNYSVEFKVLTENDLLKIKNIILEFPKSNSIEEKKGNLLVRNAIEFKQIQELIIELKNTINEDYNETFQEAIENEWDFNYFLTNYKEIYNNTLFVCNKLKSKVDSSLGETMYPILAIRKFNNKFYLWNLLDKN